MAYSLIKCNICEQKLNLKKCSNCKIVSYCSVDCQRKDWNDHKILCKMTENDRNKSDDLMEKKNIGFSDEMMIIKQIPRKVIVNMFEAIKNEERSNKIYVYTIGIVFGIVRVIPINNDGWQIPESLKELVKKSVDKRISIVRINEDLGFVTVVSKPE